MEYEEHGKQVWSVDYSCHEPSMLVSDSDDYKVPDSSFPLIGSAGAQLGSPISSLIQLQPRNQSYLDERHRASVTSSNYMKPNLSTYGQVVAASTNDPVNIPKPPQNVVSSSSALANSPAFVRPSRTPTSAKNQDKISFIINNLSIANIEPKAKEFIEVLKEEYYPWFA
nr:hypothetical protein [Tanacetum cinerariifolium]